MRACGERLKEHLRSHSHICDHANISGYHNRVENFSTVDREVQNTTRAIMEAMYIRVNDPSLNRNTGKFQLPHIWDGVLLNTSVLHLK